MAGGRGRRNHSSAAGSVDADPDGRGRDGRTAQRSAVNKMLVYNHNDFHPPFGHRHESEVDGSEIMNSAYSDVRAGDELIHDIYTAIRTSKTPDGSNAVNTLLLITFDEHGGCYDHVPPPDATPPDDSGPGEVGFEFDRLGCRVPAIAVSAYTRACPSRRSRRRSSRPTTCCTPKGRACSAHLMRTDPHVKNS